MKESIYIETSILGHLTARATEFLLPTSRSHKTGGMKIVVHSYCMLQKLLRMKQLREIQRSHLKG
ncbi:hypothetical protein [Nostoc sp.]|uniref:hypothetical protein n=1 Tax=Nostoc sp. TaxID=1180 RepID=UPI002FF59A7E